MRNSGDSSFSEARQVSEGDEVKKSFRREKSETIGCDLYGDTMGTWRQTGRWSERRGANSVSGGELPGPTVPGSDAVHGLGSLYSALTFEWCHVSACCRARVEKELGCGKPRLDGSWDLFLWGMSGDFYDHPKVSSHGWHSVLSPLDTRQGIRS